jgi:peptide/nickel transport system substrate-binding protein
MPELPAGTVTFLFTDIEGSTELLKRLGTRYGELLEEHARILREAAFSHGGREVDNQGDSFFFVFARANAALGAAVVAQRALAAKEWPDGADVRIRMGLHTGEPTVGGERYVGLGVHRAARIGAAGHGGQVLLSGATRELVDEEVDGVVVRELGLYRLKDIDRSERLYQLDIAGLPSDFPPLRAERVESQPRRSRRPLVVGALAGVIAAAVAIPVLALGGGSSHALARLDANSIGVVTGSRIVDSVSLGAPPNAIASGSDSLWIALANRNAVVRVDPTTNTIQQTILVDKGPAAIAVGGGFVWVANSLAGTVTQIDPQTNGGQVVRHFSVGNGTNDIAFGLRAVWVANGADRTVVRIDPETGSPSAPIPVDDGADAIAAGNGAVWVASESAGVVSRIDPVSRNVTDQINVGSDPVALAVGGRSIWVANSGDGTVTRIAAASGHPAGLVTGLGSGLTGVSVGTDGMVWVSNGTSGHLSEIDPDSDRVARTVAVGASPIAVATNGDNAYVAVQAAAGAHRGGTLTVLASNPSGIYAAPLPEGLDPNVGYTSMTAGSEWQLLLLTNDGLLGYRRSGGAAGYQVVPDLAASLPTVSDGGRTYTFQLRPGIPWSTGGEVRPGDIRRGIERALARSRGNAPGTYLDDIVGAKECIHAPTRCDLSRGIVTSSGSQTIVFHLTDPDPDFLYQLALPAFDAAPATTPLKAKLPLPATGPYEIASWSPKPGAVKLVRNPRFKLWSSAAQPDGYPEKIVERFGLSAEAAVAAVRSGAADLTNDGLDQTWSPKLVSSLQTRDSSRLYASPQLVSLGLWLNTRIAPFDDVRARRALNYAVDRDRLAQLNGGPLEAAVQCQILLPNLEGYRRQCPFTVHPRADGSWRAPDLAKARQLVAASGTKGQRVTLWFPDIPAGRRNGVYFVSVLNRLGFRTRLRLLPHNGAETWLPTRQAGVSGWGVDYPSPGNLFAQFSCSSYHADPRANFNLAGFCNPRIDKLTRQARALETTDPAKASRTWSMVDRLVTNEAPWVGMKTNLTPELVSRRVGNYTYCWIAASAGTAAACLDQLWVR